MCSSTSARPSAARSTGARQRVPAAFGDVIRIGRFSLVYGEDPSAGDGSTAEYTPPLRLVKDDSQELPAAPEERR